MSRLRGVPTSFSTSKPEQTVVRDVVSAVRGVVRSAEARSLKDAQSDLHLLRSRIA